MSPYLIFNGDCAEAFPFYERVLGGTVTAMHHDRTPAREQREAEIPGRVAHARLDVAGFSLLGSDAPRGDEREPGENVYVALIVPAEAAERIFRALAEGGRITMPFENTFWSPGFGMLVDRFGTPWMVSTDPSS